MTEYEFFRILLFIWIGLAPITFIALLFLTAPYGRYIRSGWGPLINAKIGWIVMEFPSPFIFYLLFIIGEQNTAPAIFFLIIWLIHYIHRTFIYPFYIKSSQNKMAISIVFMTIFFNLVNAYLNGRYIFKFAPTYSIDWFCDPRFILGVLIFFIGFYINLHSDRILRNLRAPGESGYKIPYGGFFKFVSCPNYMGEIIEWAGFAIATWSLPGLSFALWTIANLAPRAISHHKWYKKTFSDYPTDRKAILPFIL